MEFIILAIIDDYSAFASNSTRSRVNLKQILSARFDAKLLGNLTSFLGWNISSKLNGIKINQRLCALQFINDHGMETANDVRTQLPRNVDGLPARENNKERL